MAEWSPLPAKISENPGFPVHGSTFTIQEIPEAERPRERMERLGANALSDSELLAILLRTGIPGTNAIELAQKLITDFGSLHALSRCSVQQLARVKGVGKAKATQLVAAFGLGARLARESVQQSKIESPEAVYALLRDDMQQLERESLRVILLDTRHHLVRIEEISLGSLSESVAHPREIFRPAILYSAYAVILAHNHPSGDPTPSDADYRLTRRLAEVSLLLQIKLLDHIIIGTHHNGRQPWFSFKEAGVL